MFAGIARSEEFFFKGTGSLDEYFLKAYEIESVFYIHAPLDFKFLGCLVKDKNKYKDYGCSYESHYECSGSRIIIL